MSFGKIIRKIVKKWLKKDGEAGGLETIDYEQLYDERRTLRLSPEPCMFCVDRDGASAGDLNRNVHISDEMGFSRGDGDDDVAYDILDSSVYASSPFHGSTPFTGSSCDEFSSFDSSCDSSQIPVPVCVCEACYIFVSSHLPSTISASSRTAGPAAAAAAAGQPFADDDDDDDELECCPFQTRVDVRSAKLVFGKFVKSGIASSNETTKDDVGCNKSSSLSRTSNARQIHSASSERRYGRNNAEEQDETICLNPDELPVSVTVSLDGEEGYANGQRNVRNRNRWRDVPPTCFRPPPNKTICHVARRRDNFIS